jgi:hypothetical protein
VALIDLDVPYRSEGLPRPVRALLHEAERRIEEFQLRSRVPGFVPSDFRGAWEILRALSVRDLAKGNLFCEWGSGFGVVTCLASQLGFDAHGIEIDEELVDAARQLADDFNLDADFVRGSFIPRGGEACVADDDQFAWLTTEAGSAEQELGLGVDDFDVIFAYPWPDEEQVVATLFERYAAVGAMLVTYHADGNFRVRRKTRGRA